MTPRIGISRNIIFCEKRQLLHPHFWKSTFGTKIVISPKSSHTSPNCCHCRSVSKGSCTHNTHMCSSHIIWKFTQLSVSIPESGSLDCFPCNWPLRWPLVWFLLSAVSSFGICQLKAATKLKSTAHKRLSLLHQRWAEELMTPDGYPRFWGCDFGGFEIGNQGTDFCSCDLMRAIMMISILMWW